MATDLDPTFIRRCMERIIPPGYKPEDYLATVDPIRIARLVVDEVRHQLRMTQLYGPSV